MKVEKCIEILCEKGCGSVREDIEKLEAGVKLPETDGLSQKEIMTVLKELKSVMAVYGDTCRINL